MDARQLRYFLAVADHGGMTRAAEALYVSQSTLSQSVRALEEDLRVKLFEASGRGVQLTESGAAFVGPAREVNAALAQCSEAVERVARLEGGRLDIAVTEDVALTPLVPCLAAFHRRHPDVLVNVLPAADAESARDAVRAAECEVALCALPIKTSGVRVVVLGTRVLRLVLPPGWEPMLGCGGDAPRGEVGWAQLDGLPLVTAPKGEVIRDLIGTMMARFGVQPRYAVETQSMDSFPELVMNNAGAAFLPPPTAEELRSQGALVCTTEPALRQEIGLLLRVDSLSTATRAFLRVATEAAKLEIDQVGRTRGAT